MQTIFNAIGNIMSTIICYLIDLLPLSNKETIKQVVKSEPFMVGLISLIAMIVAFFVFPVLGILRKKPMPRKRRRSTMRKRKR